jgi:hypothetical protein
MSEEIEILESPPAPTDAQGVTEPVEAQAEQQEGEAKPEEKGAETEQARHDGKDDPEVVPYSRFKEVYGALKRTERELESAKGSTGKAVEQITSTGPKPKSTDYDDYDQYIEALTDWKTEQVEVKRTREIQAVRQEESKRQWDMQVAEAVAKDPNFTERGYIPQGLVASLEGTEKLVDFAYYFGENPGEAQRILAMPALAQAREIGKLEAGFAIKQNVTPRKITTNAPAPTKPVGSKETVAASKPPDDMEAYAQWRKAGGGR